MVVLKSRYPSARLCGSFHVSATKTSAPRRPGFSSLSSGVSLRRVSRFFLAFCYLCGLLLGILVYYFAGIPDLSRMRVGLLRPVSIHPMLCTSVLPFLLTAVAVYGGSHWLLFALAFIKGFSVGFVGLAIRLLGGAHGGLIRWMLCFSGIHGLPVLYCFWLRCLGSRRPPAMFRVIWPVCLAGIFGSISYFVIAPMVVRLIHF